MRRKRSPRPPSPARWPSQLSDWARVWPTPAHQHPATCRPCSGTKTTVGGVGGGAGIPGAAGTATGDKPAVETRLLRGRKSTVEPLLPGHPAWVAGRPLLPGYRGRCPESRCADPYRLFVYGRWTSAPAQARVTSNLRDGGVHPVLLADGRSVNIGVDAAGPSWIRPAVVGYAG
jgi:hypothetical protein